MLRIESLFTPEALKEQFFSESGSPDVVFEIRERFGPVLKEFSERSQVLSLFPEEKLRGVLIGMGTMLSQIERLLRKKEETNVTA